MSRQATTAAIAAPRLHDASDAELVALARRRDASAFREITRRNNRRLFRAVRGVLKDEAEAEDAVQETYFRAFLHLEDYQGTAALSTWLTRIAVNEALARVRRRRDMVELDEIADGLPEGGKIIPFPLAQSDAGNPEQSAGRAEMRRVLERAIDDLPEPFRIVFVLRFVEQMSIEETARCLGLPCETVKTRVHRAKRRLRQTLDHQIGATLADSFPFAGARCARLSDAVLRRLGIADP